MKPIIVGVDPGTTVGLAFLDVYGKVLDVESGKNLGYEDVVFEISEHGDPIIIACDKERPPELVKKLAAAFGARTFSKELSEEEKRDLTRGYAFSNDHERDALASALKAYHNIENKVRNLMTKIDELIVRYLFGSGTEKEEKIIEKEVVVLKPIEKYEQKIEQLKHEVERLQRRVDFLRGQLEKERAKRAEIEQKRREELIDEEIKKLRARNEQLRSRIWGLEKEIKRWKTIVDKLVDAFEKREISMFDLSKTPLRDRPGDFVLTTKREVFEKSKEGILVEPLYKRGKILYARVIDRKITGEQIEKIFEEYREMRKRLFKGKL